MGSGFLSRGTDWQIGTVHKVPVAMTEFMLLQLAPARYLPYLRDAEHTYFPSKSLVVEVVQHLSATWSPWMINWYKWRLLTPRLPCPWQLKGCSSKLAMGLPFDQSTAYWKVISWILGILQRVCWGYLKSHMREIKGGKEDNTYLEIIHLFVVLPFFFFFFLKHPLTAFYLQRNIMYSAAVKTQDCLLSCGIFSFCSLELLMRDWEIVV